MAVRNVERELERLAGLREQAAGIQMEQLLRALRDKVNVVIARAAKLTAEWELRALIPDLCASFEHLLTDPAKRDPQCWAKNAIAKALKDLGHSDSGIFLQGVRHVQMEPVWGGEEDTATGLRGTCALAILQCTDLTREDKLWVVMRLLTEKSPSLRKDGAIALESIGGREAALLLRLKARMGEKDNTVTGQVFESLLRIEQAPAVPFVMEFLSDRNEEVRAEAVLALGASRLTDAVSALRELLTERHLPVGEETIFRALSISRDERALDALFTVLERGRPQQAIAALLALEIHAGSREMRSRIEAAAGKRTEPEIQRERQRMFADNS